MKRKISSIIAAVLVGSMIVGSTVFAADSSTTTNTDSGSILESTEAREGKTMYAVPTAKGVGTANVDGTRVTVDYSSVTVPGAIETAVPATEKVNKETADDLASFVGADLNGGIRPLKNPIWIRIYKAGVSLNSGFGVVKQSFGVGNQYDGRTATVYHRHPDGTKTKTDVVIVNGKINIEITETGLFDYVIH